MIENSASFLLSHIRSDCYHMILCTFYHHSILVPLFHSCYHLFFFSKRRLFMCVQLCLAGIDDSMKSDVLPTNQTYYHKVRQIIIKSDKLPSNQTYYHQIRRITIKSDILSSRLNKFV